MKDESQAPGGTAPPARLIAERYRVEAQLGVRAGRSVLRVRSLQGDQQLGLVWMQGSPTSAGDAQRFARLQREYQTLRMLEHASLLQVYDYGQQADGAYYTMEWLRGPDLRERAPLPWREGCAVLRDVAGSLAILHDQALLHGQVSPRNVRCSAAGTAKLIDFGALAAFGAASERAAPAPFLPPEALAVQALDARADLYSLGVLMYFMLTQRYPYPARNHEQLRELWKVPAQPVRRHTEQVPEALDRLIMQLCALEPVQRPAGALEVVLRACEIAQLSPPQLPALRRPYLLAPALIGREQGVRRARELLLRSQHGEGGALLIEGAPGSGRSRMLDACVREAVGSGTIVVRADAAAVGCGEHGVLQLLARRLLAACPQEAARCAKPWADVLATLLPDALQQAASQRARAAQPGRNEAQLSEQPEPSPHQRSAAQPQLHELQTAQPLQAARPAQAGRRDEHASERLEPSPQAQPGRRELHSALRNWVLYVARTQHLVFVVDDVDLADEPSRAVLAGLAHGARRRRLALLLVTRAGEQPSAALETLTELAEHTATARLDRAQIAELLRSIFGSSDRLLPVAERVYALCAGNPRTALALCEWLVQRDLAGYRDGRWQLLGEPAHADLPASALALYRARLASLGDGARELAELLALSEPDECVLPLDAPLDNATEGAALQRALAELRAAGVLVRQGDRHRFAAAELRNELRAGLGPERARLLHDRIASAQQAQGDSAARLHHHQLRGSHAPHALERLMTLEVVPEHEGRGWVAVLEYACELGAARELEPGQQLRLALRCVELAALQGQRDVVERQSAPLLERLQRAEYVSAEERARLLARCGVALAVSAELSGDLGALRRLSTLPLPDVAALQLQSAHELLAGRYERSVTHKRALLALLDTTSHQLGARYARPLRLACGYELCLLAAMLGRAAAPALLLELERTPGQRGLAWRVRALHELSHGNAATATECERRAQSLELQDGPEPAYPGTSVPCELQLALWSEDLLRTKRCCDRLATLVHRYRHFAPYLVLARGAYHQLQGDARAAASCALQALTAVAPGEHPAWALAAIAHVEATHALGLFGQAVELGRGYLQLAEREQLGFARCGLLRPLAEALARTPLGKDEAVALADEHIRLLGHMKAAGIVLGLAHESRARVAIALHDPEAFEHHAQLSARAQGGGRNLALRTKYRRLMRQAELHGLTPTSVLRRAGEIHAPPIAGDTERTASSRLSTCVGTAERTRECLRLLLEMSGAGVGCLFRIEAERLQLLASTDDLASLATLQSRLQALLRASATRERSASQELACEDDEGRGYQVLWLHAAEKGERVLVGVAALHYANRRRGVTRDDVIETVAESLRAGRLFEPEEVQVQPTAL